MSTDTQKISSSDHPIKSVTVFKSSKAEVNRTFPVNLKTGQNKIQITELSSNIDTESIRVSGLGQAPRRKLYDD
ncbi:hypothetical protein PILCRDRAFT_6085 [Piloderma croceum F 1598]|uniref:DUF4140 domain-containing protein n=1 Tax=Piloderma croceum (strain F 1598) TaxID=765440 RepID=A0A0C3G3I1_PILCF|nr:hypothetical protein PILCRDRAFT_6085 [Piloderma croceum F 1598]